MNSRFGGAAQRAPVLREETAPVVTERSSSPSSLQELLQESDGSKPQQCQVEVRYFTATNWGRRHENEDRFMSQQHSLPDGPLGFHTVGVLDGHDSETASEFSCRQLPKEISRLLIEGKPVVDAYKTAMENVEDQLKSVTASAGTCVLSCTIAGRFIWAANLGDCRSILVPLALPDPSPASTASSTLPSAPRTVLPKAKVNGIVWMSRDLKAGTPWEQERIRSLGGHVVDGRVEGLEPSRTLGDFDVKASVAPGVISIVPEVRRYELGNGSEVSQAVMICATDGVWDVMTGQEVCHLISARKEIVKLQQDFVAVGETGRHSTDVLRDLAEDLVQFSIAKGSRDDCTAIVTFISVPACRDGSTSAPVKRNESL